MLSSAIPAKFPIPWANAAGGSFIRPIPEASQIGIQNGAASLTDGFVPDNFSPVASGGVPPFGKDMNGILKQITQWCQWLSAGGAINYDASFATGDSGGYPKGALVESNVVPGNYWMSTADNNTTDPDSISAANWVPDPGRVASGTPVASFATSLPNGYVSANGLTIGNAASNATGRANADTLLLYRFNWLTFSNSVCPIFTSTGSASTRGANPDADFSANKALATPNMNGDGVVGADSQFGSTSTNLSGVPVVQGNSTTPGSVLGANLQGLLTANLPVITPAGTISNINGLSAAVQFLTGAVTGGGTTILTGSSGGGFPIAISGNISSTFSGTSFGSNTAHNNVERSTVVFWNQKL